MLKAYPTHSQKRTQRCRLSQAHSQAGSHTYRCLGWRDRGVGVGVSVKARQSTRNPDTCEPSYTMKFISLWASSGLPFTVLQDTCKMTDWTPPCLHYFWVSCGDSLCKHSHLVEDSCGLILQGSQLSFALLLAVSYRRLKLLIL